MTEHYTLEEVVALVREKASANDTILSNVSDIGHDTLLATINAAVTRKLAEKELEVVRLREALEKIGEVASPYRDGVKFNYIADIAQEAHSTPSSTKHLDEYVAEKVKELKQKCGEFAEESLRNAAKLAAAEERVNELERVFLSSPLTSTLLPNGERVEVYTVLKTHADDAIERSE